SCRIFFFFQAEDGIRDATVTGVQTCALPICNGRRRGRGRQRTGWSGGDARARGGGKAEPSLRSCTALRSHKRRLHSQTWSRGAGDRKSAGEGKEGERDGAGWQTATEDTRTRT